jgi:pimeloyl-ACP methyl ester carboxylesterase
MATFCLIHGNWHDASCWDALADRLELLGHTAIAPDLPLDDPSATYRARAAVAIEALDGADAPIVVVGHSNSSGYAALTAEAVPGASLIHLCPRLGQFESPPGAPEIFRENFPFPPKNEQGAMIWDPDAAIVAMYPRLAQDTARALAEKLLPTVAPPDEYPEPAHPDVPTSLVYTTDDEFFRPEWQRFIARELLGVEPVELPGGHFPMIEEPGLLADALDRLAPRPLG